MKFLTSICSSISSSIYSGSSTPSESNHATDDEAVASEHQAFPKYRVHDIHSSSDSSGTSTPNSSTSPGLSKTSSYETSSFSIFPTVGRTKSNKIEELNEFVVKMCLGSNAMEETNSNSTDSFGEETDSLGEETDVEVPYDHRSDPRYFKDGAFDNATYIRKSKGLPAAKKFIRDASCVNAKCSVLTFLIANQHLFQDHDNVRMLLSIAIECALGGRRHIVKLCSKKYPKRKIRIFEGITSYRSINVSAMSTLGHYIIHNAWQNRFGDVETSAVRKYAANYHPQRVVSQIGGDHLWENRSSIRLSTIKRKILLSYQAKSLDQEFAYIVMTLLGVHSHC